MLAALWTARHGAYSFEIIIFVFVFLIGSVISCKYLLALSICLFI